MLFEVPLMSEELELITKSLREWEKLLLNGAGGYKPLAELVTRIEVARPWTGGEMVIGHFVLYDGQIGFRPLIEGVE